MTRPRAPVLPLLMAVALAGVAPLTFPPPAVAAEAGMPGFTEAPCASLGTPTHPRLRCGTVAVPRDPDSPGAGADRLRVVIVLSALQPARRDAVVFLNGGPGDSVVQTMSVMALAITNHWAARERDLVLIDPRGVGLSEPRLCHDIKVPSSARTTEAEYRANYRTALTRCFEQVRRQGRSLKGFSTLVTADDVERVRLALGYPAWNVYGVSYGGVTGLTLASRHPHSIRSLILDSPSLGAHSPLSIAQAVERSQLVLLAACASDPACLASYADLGGELRAAMADLKRRPLIVPMADGSTALVDDTGLARLLFLALYSRSGIAGAPGLVRAAAGRRAEVLADHIKSAQTTSNRFSLLAMGATLCTDLPLDSDRVTGYPQGACKEWTQTILAPQLPAGSTIPALVLSGAFDPVTPPASGRAAAAALGASAHFVELPATGHGVIGQSACGLAILQSFLADPASTPDTACVADVPPILFQAPEG